MRCHRTRSRGSYLDLRRVETVFQRLASIDAVTFTLVFAAGAPSYYIVVKIAALGVGSTVGWLIRRAPAQSPHVAGIITVAVAMVLLGTGLLGPRVGGASRWIHVASISLQPSLMLLPLAVVL